MKKILLFFLLSPLLTIAQSSVPLSLSAIKAQITGKLTPVGTDRITAQKQRDLMNTLAEQLELARTALSDTGTKAGPSGMGRVASIANNLFLIPQVGNAIQVPSALRSVKEFITYTQASALYDGSLWVRTTGASNTTATAGYGAMVTESVGGFYYRRIYENSILPEWFGARGNIRLVSGVLPTTAQLDTIAANTAAIQKALDYAVLAINASLDGNYSPLARNRPNSVYFSQGTYYTTSPLEIKGPVVVEGRAGQAFGGSKLQNITAGSNLINVTGSLQGGNAGFYMHHIRLTCAQTSGQGSVLYAGTSGSIHSIYLDNCWFQGADRYYIKVLKGDDLKIVDCTFDGSEHYAFYIGDESNVNNTVLNCVINRCTFYACDDGLGKVNNVDGFIFTDNRCYGAPEHPRVAIGIDMLNSAVKARHVIISNNTFARHNNTLASRFGGFIFNNNQIYDVTERVVNLGGGGYSLSDFQIQNNRISGIFSTTINQGGLTVPLAPIWAHGVGSAGSMISNAIIRNNILKDSTNASLVGVYLSDPRNSGNKIDNTIIGFATPNLVAGSADQVITTQPLITSASNLTANSLNLTQGLSGSTITTSLASWTTTAYTALFEAGTLPLDQVYELTLYITKAGQETTWQTYQVLINQMGNSNTDAADLTPELVRTSPTSSTAPALSVRIRKPQTAFVIGSVGFEAKLANSAYQGGTLAYTLIPLYKISH